MAAKDVKFGRDAREGILRGVLGKMEVAQNRVGVADGHVLEAADERPERFEVAGHAALDDGRQAGVRLEATHRSS